MKRPQQPAVKWRIVWKALHDMQYSTLFVHEAVEIIRKAGHPRPGELVHRAVKYGYAVERNLCDEAAQPPK